MRSLSAAPLVPLLLLCLGGSTASADSVSAQELTIDQAVEIALHRNHDVIAAKLEIDGAELDRVQAGLYPNPIFSYTLGDLVLGAGNPQPPLKLRPGFFDQTVQSVGLSEVLDVWAKRNTRLRAAARGIEHRRLQVQDALREIMYAVRSAFADVLREQSERELSREIRARYEETVRISRSRFAAGDISEAQLRKVELEGLRYQTAEIDAEMELDLARQKLAALLGLESPSQLPGTPADFDPPRVRSSTTELVDRSWAERPDVQAARKAIVLSEAILVRERREAFPDISFGMFYTHSEFLVSGDNPNWLTFTLTLPLPVFDRNQAGIGRALLDRRRAENDLERLRIEVQHNVAQAVRRAAQAQALLAVYEGGMLERAEHALRVAERSQQAGAISLLDLLEAQRTYLDTRSQYLRTRSNYRQAAIDIMRAVGGEQR